MPGQEFSYNNYTGERTKENGYKDAHVISGGEVTFGTGGGVCQVSSTIFNSVLYAGLDIVTRINHSIPSTYVGLGRDATVNDSGIDFVFKNNYENPVFIKNYYNNGKITCQIFGVESDKKDIEISTTVNATIEYSTIKQVDTNISEGATKALESGRKGYSVTTYRIFYDKDGNEIKKETVCQSHYPSKNAVIAVGSNKSNSNNNSNNQNPSENNPGQGENNNNGESSDKNNSETPTPGDTTPPASGEVQTPQI